MTRRVAIVGAASAGKSTLAARLAAHYGTVWVPEYLREFVDVHGRMPVAADQIAIARTQVAREQAALAQAKGFLFCDTSPLMTAVYSRHYFGGIDSELERLVQRCRYDVTLVCASDIPWEPDGQREPLDECAVIAGLLFDELDKRNISYTMVAGDAARRLLKAEQVLGKPATVGE
ncbi:AAA family ATPase [Duganella sp. FT92W]|uniref:AAA family ATPase n=1 Tax=Pseudoduganella rivuli TaxID=2666085 RepID=A0A7X2ITY7_9BURK|nr:ATP-binding protein [Pseudoduganella rivuli]MRV75890.1 AAA family ATPase [Pseudoduganella rivuli]